MPLITHCFQQSGCQCSVNGTALPDATASQWKSMMSFMHTPECLKVVGGKSPEYGCCGICTFDPVPIQIYYWPQPGADDSCMDIIGTSIHPWDYGATVITYTPKGDIHATVGTQWGCSLDTYPFTTVLAEMTSVNGFTFKQNYFNPWLSDNPCSATSLPGSKAISNRTSLSSHWSPTQFIVLTSNNLVTKDASLSTIILDGYTLSVTSIIDLWFPGSLADFI